jgi:ribulose-phosphate 3-epimerase
VPNITFGHGMVKCLRKDLGKEPFFDVHMMVSNPLQWVEPMADAGCSQYTYHFESTTDQEQVIRKVREVGMKVGLAIKPATSVDVVLPYVETVDAILVMTVEPGFGGQKFMPDMMAKVKVLREKFRSLDIEVDGGVGPSTVDQCASAGANMIVSGTAITQAPDPKSVIEQIREIAFNNQK